MKRIVALILTVLLCACLCACGKIKENVELAYEESYVIDNEKLAEYEDLLWESTDAEIADIQQGKITGNGPGSAVISATSGEKTVAEYSVTVTIVPITGIVLSTNSCEMVEEETYQLSYTLFPENASNYGLKWASANTATATVDSTGKISAVAAGQTTISVANSSGIVATCSVTVSEKPAFERLSEKEKDLLECILEHIDQFKNRDSVEIRAVQENGENWIVEISAQNGFGGRNLSVYYLSDSWGFWNWESFDMDEEVDITPDDSFDIRLLNEALDELR